MTKFTTAVAAAIIGSVSLASGAALAATPGQTAPISVSHANTTWVMMMKKKHMMRKKHMRHHMMKKKMM